MQTYFTHHKTMNTAQKADKSPLMQTENMSWEELIDRLLAIQRARDLPANWLIAQVELAGHPPKQMWRTAHDGVADALCLMQYGLRSFGGAKNV
jgi:hypothetical protein